MSDSVLDRIRQNRNRTRVPQRDDVLVTKSPSDEQGSQLDIRTSERLLKRIPRIPLRPMPPWKS
jgi:hypothetical protein